MFFTSEVVRQNHEDEKKSSDFFAVGEVHQHLDNERDDSAIFRFPMVL